ncbi:Tannase/feruloyl esterase [Aspergillus egyptiacus]|nr:Tannase/feruloyl esterase [Aspergillus egyptiacus]
MSLVPQGLASERSSLGCQNFTAPEIPDAQVLSITSHAVHNLTVPPIHPALSTELPPLTFCNVSLALTHPRENDTVFVTVALPPAEKWNGRYQATGGGGIAAGYESNMFVPLATHFASSFTDGGLTLNHTVDPQSGTWALNDDGSLNTPLLLNLAWRSGHDMAVAAKAIIQQYYGVGPSYSYWNGCSQGGRQGYAAAAHYPQDFDGILAMAPGLSLEYVGPAAFWPVVAMRNEGEMVPACIFDHFQQAIIAACDPLDGLTDGAPCGHTTRTITARHATIVRKILEGPRTDNGTQLWYGLAPGASFTGVAGLTVNKNGTPIPAPFAPAAAWLKYTVLRNTTHDITQLTYAEYLRAFNRSIAQGKPLLSTESLNDLSAFRAGGGKLLTWVGLADQYIPPSNLFAYHDALVERFGSNRSAVNDFYRVFSAPGVGHCGGGPGPQPRDAMPALMDWVENGTAPETLPAWGVAANGSVVSRALCMYPERLVYQAKGGLTMKLRPGA